MPAFWKRLTSAGAIVKVDIGLSTKTVQALRQGLQPLPPTVRCHALLDTGAEKTCVDESVCRDLGFDYEGIELVNVPYQQSELTFGIQHDTDLTIVHPARHKQKNLALRNLAVVELALNSFDFQVIIGRDVLAHCQFLYNGPGRRFILRY